MNIPQQRCPINISSIEQFNLLVLQNKEFSLFWFNIKSYNVHDLRSNMSTLQQKTINSKIKFHWIFDTKLIWLDQHNTSCNLLYWCKKSPHWCSQFPDLTSILSISFEFQNEINYQNKMSVINNIIQIRNNHWCKSL